MITSIKNAIHILNCFTVSSPVLGISELSNTLSMKKSTVHHTVKSLNEEGILIRTQDRKYRLGSKILSWGDIVTKQYRPYFGSFPYLNELVSKTNETVHLAIRENEGVSYLLKLEPETPVKIKTSIGSKRPLYCTAVGKVLLSYQNLNIDNLIMGKYTKNTISTKEILHQEIENVKKRGYAIDDEEFEEGLYCIAAPVRDMMGTVVCAISISGPEFRMKKEKETYISYILRTVNKISTHWDE